MGILSDIIGLIIGAVLAPCWFSNLYIEEGESAYTIFFRLIYPKWLSLKQKQKYNRISIGQFRHLQYEHKRLKVGVTILK